MNITSYDGSVGRFFRRNLAALAVVALVLATAAAGCAQSPPGGAKTTTQSAAAAAPKTASKPSASNGMSTGIKVHGHWTINILTKDGKLVSHHEFENSLAYGAPILSNLLGGNATPGGLAILLGGTACPLGPLNTLSGFPATCAIVVAGSAMAVTNSSGGMPVLNETFLVSGQHTDLVMCTDVGANCSDTLTISSNTGTPSNPGSPLLTLSGTYNVSSSAPSGASISGVAVTGYICSPSTTIAACQGPAPQGNPPYLVINESIPAPGGGVGTVLFTAITPAITATPLATSIPVGAGQTIQATVVISFSS